MGSIQPQTLNRTNRINQDMAETISLHSVYEELKQIEKKMVTKKDLWSILETWEIMQNPETMKSIRESEKDICEGRVKEIRSFQDILDDLEE